MRIQAVGEAGRVIVPAGYLDSLFGEFIGPDKISGTGKGLSKAQRGLADPPVIVAGLLDCDPLLADAGGTGQRADLSGAVPCLPERCRGAAEEADVLRRIRGGESGEESRQGRN